ncbi:hypothetical protein C9J44_04050 [Photobacterium sp. GB-27]|nr:hypothetical protein C9J44_04050 [Photobacterium sp. GB-27]
MNSTAVVGGRGSVGCTGSVGGTGSVGSSGSVGGEGLPMHSTASQNHDALLGTSQLPGLFLA